MPIMFQVPKTCENFVKLCKKGYYDNVVFHRLIRNFMVRLYITVIATVLAVIYFPMFTI